MTDSVCTRPTVATYHTPPTMSLSDTRERVKVDAARTMTGSHAGAMRELCDSPGESTSILLYAVGVGRAAVKNENASATCVLVVYRTSESMVAGVKEYLDRADADADTDVIMCATKEADHKAMLAMEKRTSTRFACFWNSSEAQEPRDVDSMYDNEFLGEYIGRCEHDGLRDCECLPGWIKGAPLAPKTWPKGDPRNSVLILCFSTETLKNDMQRKSIETVLSKSRGLGLKVSLVVTEGRLKRDEFANMDISEFLCWPPANLDWPSWDYSRCASRSRVDDAALSHGVKRRRNTNTGAARRREFSSFRRELTAEEMNNLREHNKIWFTTRQELHTLFTMYPNPANFSPEETYTAQMREHFDKRGETLSVDSIKDWEKRLTHRDTVTVPGSKHDDTRTISEVVEEMRQKQLDYIGILYFDNLQRQKKQVRDERGSVDTEQAYEDAMKRLVGNKLVSVILEADMRAKERCVLLPQRRENCQTLLQKYINHSQTFGLSKFRQMTSNM